MLQAINVLFDKDSVMQVIKEDIEPLKPIIQKLFDEELEKHKDIII